jgi:formylmethanofuran dehydrogenase subunit E
MHRMAGRTNTKFLVHEDDEVLVAIKRLKQAEMNDELWCDECHSYYPSQQGKLIGNDWLCDVCSLKRDN